MNNKIQLLFIALAIGLVGCQKPLEISNKAITQNKLSICQEATCPSIEVVYIKVEGDPQVSNKINEVIEDFAIQSLRIDEDNSNAPNTIEDAMIGFVETYRLHSAEFPGMGAAYFAEISVTESFRSEGILSLACESYLYTGGAHGNSTLQFKNFDPETGILLTMNDIFKDLSAFKEVAEQRFRQVHNIASSESINTTGFWFENDTFILPKTIGFTKEGAVLHYNTYDIAPYASGPIDIEIPRTQLEPLLKIAFE